MSESIIVFCAHPDDQIFGAGGTLAKYSKEGVNVITVIFSNGESSHPLFKKEITAEMRRKETERAEKIIGGKKTFFFALSEGKFLEEAGEKKIEKKIEKIIKRYKPSKIFTHTGADPHPDHKSVESLVLDVFDSMKFYCDVYSFDVWNFLNIKEVAAPKLIVDVSKTFKKKIKALKCFKSQKMALISLMGNVYVKAISHGLKHHCKFAEVFYKIR